MNFLKFVLFCVAVVALTFLLLVDSEKGASFSLGKQNAMHTCINLPIIEKKVYFPEEYEKGFLSVDCKKYRIWYKNVERVSRSEATLPPNKY